MDDASFPKKTYLVIIEDADADVVETLKAMFAEKLGLCGNVAVIGLSGPDFKMYEVDTATMQMTKI